MRSEQEGAAQQRPPGHHSAAQPVLLAEGTRMQGMRILGLAICSACQLESIAAGRYRTKSHGNMTAYIINILATICLHSYGNTTPFVVNINNINNWCIVVTCIPGAPWSGPPPAALCALPCSSAPPLLRPCRRRRRHPPAGHWPVVWPPQG